MRSALYRRLDVLRAARIRPTGVTNRPWSSTPAPDDNGHPRFPLYRPEPEPAPPADHTPSRPRMSEHNLPSDKKIRKTAKAQLTERAIADLPELQEEDLRDFYAAVMESGRDDLDLGGEIPQVEAPGRRSKVDRRKILDGLSHRLLPSPDRAGPSTSTTTTAVAGPTDDSADMDIVSKLVAELRALVPQPGDTGRVSLGLISRTEWNVLLDQSARYGPAYEAEEVLQLMTSHGTLPNQQQVTRVMEAYARSGRVTDVARLHDSMKHAGMAPTNRSSDLLMEAHLHHSPPLIYPAIDLLSSLAATGTPLPQSSYNVLLTHLTSSSPTSQTRALAWDLWANMRLTAHPTPVKEVYNTMIRACADTRDPQPERARDLWIELTSAPGAGAVAERAEYDAIIRALSSTKRTYLEAFDLLRQMLAKHSEATFVPFDESPQAVERWSRYVPTLETFTALLEGTKRAGDLPRARWVLNEVVRLQASGLVAVNEELLSGVFMTYASWVPLVRRSAVKPGRNDGGKGKGKEEEIEEAMTPAETDDIAPAASRDGLAKAGETTHDIDAAQQRSAHPDPLTSADALREADALFEQILADTSSTGQGIENEEATGPFSDVRLTTRLVNSYLSVHLAHAATIPAAREAWDKTWALCATASVPNGWSHLQVFERCAAGEMREDRHAATVWAQETWARYTSFASEHTAGALDFSSLGPLPLVSHEQKQRQYALGLGYRQLERAFRSYIRLLALSPSTPADESLAQMARFHTLFPPSNVLSTYSPTPETSFKIRLTDPTALSESDIPPVLLWPDVDVLHQRLVREGRKKDIGWLTWVCKSYEVALRKRRRWRLKKRGEARPPARSAGELGGGVHDEIFAENEDEEDRI